MSGIVGIYHRDGAPAERVLLQSLVDFLAFRGPDSQEWYADGPIGLGHTILRTTHESMGERQPASLEGRFWITADARLDARGELLSELKRSGRIVRPNAPDSDLILNAYAAWGTPCVEHLRGDFSFAIWDSRNKQLFCARDHFGIKPFYYAHPRHLFVFSNTLNCIRLHPDVPAELNDAAVGDFLLFGLNYDNSTTTFRDIQRLPPAHTLTISAGHLQVKRYWTPPTDGHIRYTKPEEYVENFLSVLKEAVTDRLRTDHVGILLSGGLDSSSVAAVGKHICGQNAAPAALRGYTFIYRSLIPDQEETYTREVADFLRIPVRFTAMDDAQLFDRWSDPAVLGPEPSEDPFLARLSEAYRDISAETRVLLSGEGGDDLMNFQMWSYMRDLRRRGEWRKLVTDVANYLWVKPFPWRGIRTRALRLLGKDPDQPVYPRWLATEFKRRANLEERWKEEAQRPRPKSWPVHPIHPRAYAALASPLWTHTFEQDDPGATHCLVETRHPFLDVRMVNFLLALPPFPWFFRKTLLREAMAGRLPERIRVRPKTPLQGDPISAQITLNGTDHLKQLSWSPEMDRYVDRSAMVTPHATMDQEEASGCLRPYCLNIWLQSAHKFRYNIHAEARNG